MGKHSLRLLSMVLALIMAASLVITGAPLHVHAAEDIVVTVGASGCDYTTINAALDAIAGMSRSSGQRAVIEIQPGNYEEMLRIDLDNITLRNASSSPSIALKNKGVDIDANAVRITSYYGHGYNYYSMNSSYLWDADTLASNKSKGSASVTNPGSGSATHWNATVVVSGDNFIAEDIIFENSFNQYVSAKAANDVIIDNGSAKEGSTARGKLSKGSTAVQDKAYVERAAALAIKNNTAKVSFDHCKFVGRQDTLYGGSSVTAAFYDCEIYGACDYIFGPMTAVFAKCDLVFNTSDSSNDVGYITAGQQKSTSVRGYLMYNCTVTSTTPGVDTASTYPSKPGFFGRPWAKDTCEVIFYHTVIKASHSNWHFKYGKSLIQSDGWKSGLGGSTKRSGEYGTYEVSGVDNSDVRLDWGIVFTEPKLTDGTDMSVSNFLGSWNPFSGKDMTIVTDGSTVEPEQPTTTTAPSTTSAPSATTAPSGGDSGTTVPAGEYVHIFAENGKNSDFYTITGDGTSTSKGSVTVNGTTYGTCFKMNSAGKIIFNAPAAGTFTMIFSTSNAGNKIDLNGTVYTVPADGVLTMDVAAGANTVVRNSGESFVFYMVYAPEGTSGGESGGTEETVTATGELNMSKVTVTKAAGAADPTTVDTALLSGLTMTVTYSNGNTASIGLSNLVISNIKTHDTMGNYIDVDYNDPVTGTKVHCYILVTIEESGETHTHSYTSSVTTAATCTAAGVRTYKCSCGDTYTEAIAALGHSYSDGKCTVCGASQSSSGATSTYSFDATRDVTAGTDKDVISAGTTYTNGYFTVTGTVTQRVSSGAVTCVEVGKNSTGALQFTVTGTATVEVQFSSTGGSNTSAIGLQDASGNLIANNEGITEVTGASSGKTVVTYNLGAGTYSVVSPASDYNRGARVFYINVTEQTSGGDVHTHSYTESVTTEATCTADGVKTFTCSCGESYTEAIKATGHTEVTVAGKAATCTEKGLTEGKKCSVCGEVTAAQTEIAALGHSYKSVVTAPTCTEGGYTTYTCSTCGNAYTGNQTAAKGHNYSSAVTQTPDCTNSGVRTYTCSACSDSYTEAIAALGHTNAAAVKENEKAASCGADGSYDSVVYCSSCGVEISRNTITVPATGEHVYATETKRVEPTCTADGYVVMACGCGATQQTTLKATGHTEVTIAGKAANCTASGLTDGTKCSVCNEILTAQTVIPALGHTNAAAVKENEKAATCTASGSYDNVVYCSVCRAEVSRTTVTVEATGHTLVTDAAVAPTCTATGKTEGKHCSVCGQIAVAQQTVDALGHKFVDGVCTVCGAKDPEYVAGVTVSGEFVSSGDKSDVVTIQLILEGQTEAAYSFVSDGSDNSGEWSIEGVAAGNYTVKVMKADHVTREYAITVADTAVTQNVMICLLGDVNNDGNVNISDYVSILTQVKNPSAPVLVDYCRQCADTDGNGAINFMDYLALLSHVKNVNRLW